MGMTFKSFILPRNTPAVKEISSISAKCVAIELFGSLIILVGILFRPADLQFFKEIIFDISWPVVGATMNDSKLLSGRKYSIDLLEIVIFA